MNEALDRSLGRLARGVAGPEDQVRVARHVVRLEGELQRFTQQYDLLREVAAGDEARDRSAAHHLEDIVRLEPLVHELAARHPEGEVTVFELRALAAERGILPMKGNGRELSYLSAVFKAAGFRTTGERRRNAIPGTHGNIVSVWRRKESTDGHHGRLTA